MSGVTFPKQLLDPIKQYLIDKQKQLQRRKAALSMEDPFSDTDRLVDNAAIDADAAEQFGHENVSAMKKEVDKMLIRIKKTLTRINIGTYGVCAGCGNMIDTHRLQINPTATYCMSCEQTRVSHRL